ncbi:MAG: type 2 isopentenyl-diphosphate Delta-isomerase [Holosporales bacterium]|jgi:isopentenyl-diphosphate delta-isomerase|nr:type 2 isopentenyl-diphosphate Delta-isomerase [Holosporales bacterium]
MVRQRKGEHLKICLKHDVQSGIATGFSAYTLNPTALPEHDLHAIDLTTTFLGHTLKAPLLISAMTGGSSLGARLNARFAQAAQTYGIAMGVGSQRVALEHPELKETFSVVRTHAPRGVLFANLGAVQLNYGRGIEDCIRCVEMIEAQALVLHFNALQEALQPGGNTHFAGILRKVTSLCREFPVPVIAKEVGSGFSAQDARRLVEAGVSAIDIAGAGGTSWSAVEMHRSPDTTVHKSFRSWGVPTARSLVTVRAAAPHIPLIVSGGIRSGHDIIKGLALGASLAGMALPFLKAAALSETALMRAVETLLTELKTIMFCIGAANIAALVATPCLSEDTTDPRTLTKNFYSGT